MKTEKQILKEINQTLKESKAIIRRLKEIEKEKEKRKEAFISLIEKNSFKVEIKDKK